MDGHYIGLMSGTSMDAVDAALVALRGERTTLVAVHSIPLAAELRARVLAAAHDHATSIAHAGELDVQLGRVFADAALALLAEADIGAADVGAIGSHGQTIYHHPHGATPTTLQIGDPNIIAERTGITTVADFRRRDMAAGGQGAPLVPAFHGAVFRSATEDRVVVNLGGIANMTGLPRAPTEPVHGFDCGPGNVLIDYWINKECGRDFDRNGDWAAAGRIHPPLLNALLQDGYFSLPPPKSTGREYFNPTWLENTLAQFTSDIEAADVQATLCELTAVTVTRAIEQYATSSSRVLVCGGGAHNRHLLSRLRALLAPRSVDSTEAHAIPPQWVEAMAFAWLARQTLLGLPGNLPAVTGARHPVVLGAVYSGRYSRGNPTPIV